MRVKPARKKTFIFDLTTCFLFIFLKMSDSILHESQTFVFEDVIRARVHDRISFFFHFFDVVIYPDDILRYEWIISWLSFAS